jgi:hypothetical protein
MSSVLNTRYIWKICILLTSLLVSDMIGCPVAATEKNTVYQEVDTAMLDFYRQYGDYTYPGEYEELFTDLPDSFAELCDLVKAQFIHPIADLPRYRHLIPKERHNEDAQYPTVEKLLAGLLNHNPAGLIPDRKPEHRLVVTCRYHAILFAAILKYRGIPVRVRYGFARYLAPGRHIYHVICEVWNEREHRWIFVDPDRKMVDFPREQFELAGDVWLHYQHRDLDPSTYGVMDWWGPHPILDVLCHDFVAVQGNEALYWDQPPISADEQMDVSNIAKDQVEILNRIAELLRAPDHHLQELQSIYETYQFLQFP